MIRVQADLLVDVAFLAGTTKGRSDQGAGGVENRPANEGELAHLNTILGHCQELELVASTMAFNRIVRAAKMGGTNQQVADLLADFRLRLADELSARACLMIEPHEAKLFTDPHPFGPEVAAAFPSTTIDIEEAGKCLALDRGTATVFHLMRVVEMGLRVLGKSLNDPALDPKRNPSWEAILKKAEDELRKPLAQRSPEWRQNEVFNSSAVASLRAIKDAWRNPTMHVEIHYSETQAGDVWHSAKGFMRHLATKLHE